MGICLSYSSKKNLLQSIGNHFADKAIDHVKNGAKFQGTGDNWDQQIRVHEMRKDHQNVDCHYFASNLVVERVPCDHLDNTTSKGNIRQAANIEFLLSQEELLCLREEFKIMVGRVLTEFIPELRFLKTVLPDHISHPYSQEMAKKSTIIPLPMLFKDEKKYDDVVDILDSYEAWLEEIYSKAGVVHVSQPQVSQTPAVVPCITAPATHAPALVPCVPAAAPHLPAAVIHKPATAPCAPVAAPHIPAPCVPAATPHVPAPHVPAAGRHIPAPAPRVLAPHVPAAALHVPVSASAPHVPAVLLHNLTGLQSLPDQPGVCIYQNKNVFLKGRLDYYLH